MRVRRCGVLMLEPGERVDFDLPTSTPAAAAWFDAQWTAIAPHPTKDRRYCRRGGRARRDLADAVERRSALSRSMATTSSQASSKRISPSWPTARPTARPHSARYRLALRVGRDALRLALARRRHRGRAAAIIDELHGGELLDRARARARRSASAAAPTLASRCHARPTPLDALLDGRVTCRNFDPPSPLPQAAFRRRALSRVWRARRRRLRARRADPQERRAVGGRPASDRSVSPGPPVEGIAPGLYHYHAVDHALEPIHCLRRTKPRRSLDASSARRRISSTRLCSWSRRAVSAAISGNTEITRRRTARCARRRPSVADALSRRDRARASGFHHCGSQ